MPAALPRLLLAVVLLAGTLACKPVEQGPPLPSRGDEPIGGTVAMGGKTTGAPPQGMPDFQKAISVDFSWDAERSAVVAAVRLEPGYHAYGQGEETGRPLTMEVSSDGWTIKELKLPKGVEKDLGVLGKSVVVTGKVEVAAVVEAVGDTANSVAGLLRYQVCTAKACDRPRSMPFQVTPR